MKIKTFNIELGLELFRNILEINILAELLNAQVDFFPDSSLITARFKDNEKNHICTSINDTFDYNVRQIHSWLVTKAKERELV